MPAQRVIPSYGYRSDQFDSSTSSSPQQNTQHCDDGIRYLQPHPLTNMAFLGGGTDIKGEVKF